MTSGASEYVLLIDDDADIRCTIEVALDLYGYTVVSVAGGSEALEWLRGGRKPPYLILLDFMMPGMSGAQFRSEQRRDPALASIPTVVVTGAGALSDVDAEVLAAEVLRKPISLETLLSTVRRYAPASG